MSRSDTSQVYEELLVTLARGGDRRAAELLAKRWYPRLMRTALRLLRDRDQAQDAVQETWTGICRGLGRLSDPAKFPAWAYGILHRKCADRIRNEQKARARTTAIEEAPEPSQPERSELRHAIDQALGLLSPDHREAALLFFGEGFSLKEIAAATGVPVGTAKSRIFHARQYLKASLKGDL